MWIICLAGNKCKQFYYKLFGAYQIFSGDQVLAKNLVFS